MSTCRRQPSTLLFCDSVSTTSDTSLMASLVRACYDEPSPPLLAGSRGQKNSFRLLQRCRIPPPQKLLDARLEHGALGLGVGAELLEATAHLGLDLADTAVECGEPLVALAFEPLRRVGEPALEALRPGVAHMGEPLRE